MSRWCHRAVALCLTGLVASCAGGDVAQVVAQDVAADLATPADLIEPDAAPDAAYDAAGPRADAASVAGSEAGTDASDGADVANELAEGVAPDAIDVATELAGDISEALDIAEPDAPDVALDAAPDLDVVATSDATEDVPDLDDIAGDVAPDPDLDDTPDLASDQWDGCKPLPKGFIPDDMLVNGDIPEGVPGCLPTEPVLAPPGAQKSPLAATGGFVEVTAAMPLSQIGVDPGSPTFVPYGASVASFDADGDGDIDLVFTDGMSTLHLLEQTAPWTFEATIPTPPSMGTLAAVAALDLDDGTGRPAIVAGGNVLVLLVSDGQGGYTDETQARGLPVNFMQGPIHHILPTDLDGDGLMDLLLSRQACSYTAPALMALVSRGAGGFVDMTKALGLDGLVGYTWATLESDPQGDGLTDLMVLQDQCPKFDKGVALYRRQPPGGEGPAFQLEQLPPMFLAPLGPQQGTPMGGTAADVNGDSVLDYLFSQKELTFVAQLGLPMDPPDLTNPFVLLDKTNDLVLSQPDGGWAFAGIWAGIGAPLSPTGMSMVSWTVRMPDLDHDGHLDIVMSHGYDYGAWVLADDGGMRPSVFRNDGTQHFVELSEAWGLPPMHTGRGMVMPDVDGDGDLDLLLGGQGMGPRAYRNDLQHGGGDLAVRLEGRVSNRWGLGARLTLTTGARTILAEHGVHAIVHGMEWPITHFQLAPGEKALSLAVTWPSGWTQNVAIGPSTAPMLVVEESIAFAPQATWLPQGGDVTLTLDCTKAGATLCQPDTAAIELAPPIKGAWKGPLGCSQGVCTRVWSVVASSTAGPATFRASLGGLALKVRPKVWF